MGQNEVRVLDLAEIETLVGWAVEEGWNPGYEDPAAFQAADPRGFLGCFVDGRLVAGIAAIAYDDHYGFIGLYICRTDMRGKGHGRRVWDAGMERLGDRVIGLDGVAPQQANYQTMGFETLYETVRWSGLSTGPDHELVQSVRHPTTDDLPAIEALDRLYFPAHRSAFLQTWIGEHRIAYLAESRSGIDGYIVIRRCRDGYKIGPLFAASEEVASGLLQAALSVHPGEVMHIDVPRHQESLTRELDALGFAPGFTTARMYRGEAPDTDLSGVYGVTTLELG
ncbi:GNAT family N-acetyltransferase [Rhizobium halophytocola]|uniref:Ribosomal protein S18 acetylase RimI-like enzyme n=1 Tax=Rhizobium halophytocola TaxID=735519 RepID=A0ABS4E4W6_9HYPH|nr:GNAT family N-acetyltransferase [Rhizobium halophytocola]MBP1852991.1 ribosomal protein S18 acetylase RimI-like enzyme [Rhizobium halophytocola]